MQQTAPPAIKKVLALHVSNARTTTYTLPLLGSNQDSSDPESDMLPVTPRGTYPAPISSAGQPINIHPLPLPSQPSYFNGIHFPSTTVCINAYSYILEHYQQQYRHNTHPKHLSPTPPNRALPPDPLRTRIPSPHHRGYHHPLVGYSTRPVPTHQASPNPHPAPPHQHPKAHKRPHLG